MEETDGGGGVGEKAELGEDAGDAERNIGRWIWRQEGGKTRKPRMEMDKIKTMERQCEKGGCLPRGLRGRRKRAKPEEVKS
jgi:hypothetical protein